MLPPILLRMLAATGLLALLSCGGGYNSGTGIPNQISGTCDPGTQVQLARPLSGQTGVGSGTTQIVIVASGNSNALYNTYASWDLILQDNFGNQFATGALTLTSNGSNGYPTPYPSDFYYAGSISGLSSGQSYAVGLNIFSSNCSPDFIGSFFT